MTLAAELAAALADAADALAAEALVVELWLAAREPRTPPRMGGQAGAALVRVV